MPAKTKPQMPPTPELDKMKAVRDQSQAIGEFLDWLVHERSPRTALGVFPEEHEVLCQRQPPEAQRQADDLLDLSAELKGGKARHRQPAAHPKRCVCKGTGYVTIRTERDEFMPIPTRIQSLLAEYYEIDEQEAERERMLVLDYARAMNDWRDDGE